MDLLWQTMVSFFYLVYTLPCPGLISVNERKSQYSPFALIAYSEKEQRFREFISVNTELYWEIIGPLGYSARKKNEEFLKECAQIVNKFTIEFSEIFVTNGEINWDALVKYNSAKTR